jgi:hypothetical protein
MKRDNALAEALARLGERDAILEAIAAQQEKKTSAAKQSTERDDAQDLPMIALMQSGDQTSEHGAT